MIVFKNIIFSFVRLSFARQTNTTRTEMKLQSKTDTIKGTIAAN